MNNRNIIITLAIIGAFLHSCAPSAKLNPEITPDELRDHIGYLASEELQGRLPGTPGDIDAAKYIRDRLALSGLEPFDGDGLQEFELVANVIPGNNNSLSFNEKEFEPGKDFSPFAFSENGEITSEVVFAGYGFDIDDDSIRWNDYSDLEVKDKWVLILRADPEVDNTMSNFARYSGDRDKCMTARDKGAAGVLLVSGVSFDQKDEFEPLRGGEFSVGIPVLRISRIVADLLLESSGKTIARLEKEINENRTVVSFATGTELTASSDLREEKLVTRNVIMKLEGHDRSLSGQYVIIGGHFDHLGLGGSSSRMPDTTAVHYGADDNASGIAAMIEIAGKAAASKLNGRTLVFAAFAAEEMGLLGSKYMADNLPFNASDVNAMINLDMVGRLKESRDLQVGGVGTAPGLKELVYSNIDTTSFNLSLSEEGFGPSDHSAFYGKDIPVLFISTGAHLDYHTPFDSPARINYDGLSEVSAIVYNITEKLSTEPGRLTFTEAGPKTQVSRGSRRKGVTLGIMPDFAGNVKNGLRADFVTPGRPAAIGGMIKGDIIKSINGMKINNIQDYMFRLSKLNNGDRITVEVERDGSTEVLIITL